MTVEKVSLIHFRNYNKAVLQPSKGTTVLYGQNGVGKTNAIEAIHLCALGRSHRLQRDQDLIMRGEESALVTVDSIRRDGTHQVCVKLNSKEQKKKQITINQKTPKRLGEMMGHVTCVIFSPEDLSLIKEGPAGRRRFMDMLLCQQSSSYFYELQKYMTSLNQRNMLLKEMMGYYQPSKADLLSAWEEQLAKAGAIIVKKRLQFIMALEKLVKENYRNLCGNENEKFKIWYRGIVNQEALTEKIEEKLVKELEMARSDDARRGNTSFGPHRDDLVMTLSGKDMKTFASQGQIRTAALSLKLSEITLLTKQHDEAPILLLDDVMSELDMQRRSYLLEYIAGIQTIVTCTDESDFPSNKTDERLRVSLDKKGQAVLG